MLQLSSSYLNKKVMSLQDGEVVGQTDSLVINPNNLKIEGWFVNDSYQKEFKILLTQDVREILRDILVVDSYQSLTEVEDLVRLQEVIEADFELLGKKVITTENKKLGTVSDFAVDAESLYIQSLYVDPPMLKNFGLRQTQKIVGRRQIVEINDSEIIVKSATLRSKARATVAA